MAIYHCSVKPIQRSKGRSATGAAAYRAAEKIIDQRSGLTHDYGRKSGVDYTEIIGWDDGREALWNAAELAEKRKDATTAKEYELAIPKELSKQKQFALVHGYGQWLHERHQCAVDICLHDLESDNPHAHILTTTREVINGNQLGNKIAREWSDTKRKKHGLPGRKADLQEAREEWEKQANLALDHSGFQERINHRTLEAQGIERIPQIHLGPHVVEMELKNIPTDRGSEALRIDQDNAKIVDLQQYREAIEHERNLENKKREERGRTGPESRTTNPSLSKSERRDKAEHEFSKSNVGTVELSQPGASENLESTTGASRLSDSGANQARSSKNQSVSSQAGRSGKDLKTSNQELDMATLANGQSGFHDAYAGPADRIIALSRSSDTHQRGDNMAHSKTKLDRTYLAVKRQIEAMGCREYEVGIRDQQGRMLSRTWDQKSLLKSVSWLKRENAKGADIYIRPAGENNQGLVLVDDVSQGQIQNMKQQGHEPALVVETSPQNHQAWVRISSEPLAPEHATVISKVLAKTHQADENSADWRHYGRLAGFTNRKPEHTTETGHNPWVLCHESSGKPASCGLDLVQGTQQTLDNIRVKREQERRLNAAKTASEPCRGRNAVYEYQYQLKRLNARYGANMDVSRADYMICKDMLKKGYSEEQLEKTLLKASPGVCERKKGHEQDYCERTVRAALRDPEVQQHLERQIDRDRSPGLGI